MPLNGKRAIVTGSTRGMGRAIAQAFVAEGAQVAVWGRSAAAAATAAREIGAAAGFGADLADPGATAAAFAESLAALGGLDILVNNAGISGAAAPFLSMAPDEWDRMLAVNLTAPMRLSQLAARHMAGTGGAILMNASIAASGADGAFAHYSASKAGLLALTRGMAVELAPHGIRVNAVSPGYTRTDMTMQYFGAEMADFLDKGFLRAPTRRIVEAEEVAQAFVFLASDRAAGITGTNLTVDGGLTANLFIMETFPDAAGPAR
jgi:NAD(P)-dependent dehydrogenase (short-subunit alcohol dehydrogenase family)